MSKFWDKFTAIFVEPLSRCPDKSHHELRFEYQVRHGYVEKCLKCGRTVCKRSTGWDEYIDWAEKGVR